MILEVLKFIGFIFALIGSLAFGCWLMDLSLRRHAQYLKEEYDREDKS